MNYTTGSTDPALWRDSGAGRWNSTPATLECKAKKVFMQNGLVHAAVLVGFNASKHLGHYLGNTGLDLMIDLGCMLEKVATARDIFNSEVKEAKEFAETLPPGTWKITSTKASPGYNIPEESRDWFYAVGGYQAWGKATVVVPPLADSPRVYSMDFEYCFFDQYNWNKGIGVPLFGMKITDDTMGEFHRQGIAKEFEMRGSHHASVEWQAGKAAAVNVDPKMLDAALGPIYHKTSL